MDVLLQDIRFALRSLRRAPGYTAIVITVMALGIGVNTMVFSMVYAVLYRPVPLPHPEALYYLETFEPKKHESGRGDGVSFMNLRDLREHSRSFESLGGWWEHNAYVTIGREPERLFASTVSYDLFDALGVKPILGRGFTKDEETWNRNWASVILSHKVWTERYHSDPNVLGRTLRINGRTRTIVGVMPPKFRWPENQDFFLPMGFDPSDEKPNSFQLSAVARLKPGVSIEQGNAELTTRMAALEKASPKELEGMSERLVPLMEHFNGIVKPTMLTMLAAVGFVLLIACANVANLMLARAANRRREISLRMALGASRGRIVRQLLTESVVVAFGGALFGILLAQWGNRIWISTIPLELPMFMDFSIDTVPLLYTVAITVVAGLLFGFAPALHAGDTRLGEAMREGSAQSGSSRGRNRLRSALVVAEVAFSLVLLVGAGLMIRSFAKLTELSGSVRTEGVVTGAVLLPFASYPAAEQRRTFFHQLLSEVRTIPGVDEASMVQQLPLNRNNWDRRLLAEGTTYTDPKRGLKTNYGVAAPGYFHTLRIPLQRGRDFTASDDTTSMRVAIVNESLANKLWPGQDPLGRRLRFATEPDSLGWATVIGEVGDVMQSFDDRDVRYHVYVPHDQEPLQMMTLVVDSRQASGLLTAKIRDHIRSHDPDLAFVDVRTMDEHIRFSMWMQRLFMGLFSFFAALALLIAAVGLYGVMSYSVAQRTQEIGIRMALGADRQRVVGLVVGQATQLLLIGCGIGLAGAWTLTRVMASMLFGVSPSDPPTFFGVALILAATGMVAAWVPAQRATRVDPMVALRTE